MNQDAKMSNSMITITLVYTSSGHSESIPIDASTTTVNDLLEWASALFGIDGDVANNSLQLFKDGRPLGNDNNAMLKLSQLNIVNGDLIAVQKQQGQRSTHQQQAQSISSANGGSGFGGLDFSNLLTANAPLTSTTALSSSAPNAQRLPDPVYYPGMNLDDAMMHNPHPYSFVTLLLQKEHLLKELNYHNPRLASRFTNPNGQKISIEQAASIWREEMVKGGIQSAMKASERFHKENTMKKRLENNPNDTEAIEYFSKKQSQALIDQQYHQMMEEYPEALGRVLMLYIEVKINGYSIQAFCDSGAQATIISKRIAQQCQIDHLIDTRFAGVAVGVGTGTILGRIHMVQLQINDSFFPCSVTVMDDPPNNNSNDNDRGSGGKDMPFLLGLDMMKRHLCHIDLERGVLKFRLGSNEYMEAKFLHEKDLTEAQGGTKGFDPNKANEELMELQAMEEEDNGDGRNSKNEKK